MICMKEYGSRTQQGRYFLTSKFFWKLKKSLWNPSNQPTIQCQIFVPALNQRIFWWGQFNKTFKVLQV